jgi:hypothetical protein
MEETMKVNEKNLKTTIIWVTGACWILLAATLLPNARAQNPPAPGGRFGRAHFVGARPFSEGRVVTGAPYSAQAVTEHTETLPDGNTIHTTTTVNVYRDSQGRTRREQEIRAIGPWAAQGAPRKIISIADPVGGSRYTLNPDTQEARQMPFRTPAGAWKGAGTAAKTAWQRPENPNVKTESLGTQVIGGVTAEGTRTTRTIPTGQIGNQAPLVITIERWYSPELQTVVMRKEVNPQFGQTTFQLTNIVRAEPDPSLFQVPPNFTIKSGRPFPRGKGPAAKTPSQQ